MNQLRRMSPHPASRAILAALLACLVLACGPEAEPDDRPVVGVSLLNQQHDFYKDLEASLREGAKERGLRLIVQSAENDPVRQMSQLENFITQKVDALVVCPVNSSGIGGSIRQANQADIPVFTADIRATGGKVTSHIASDNVEGGRLAAQRMAELLSGKGDVIVLDHPEVASVQERVDGFVEELSKHPDIRIIDRPAAGGLRDKAYAMAETMLLANPDLAGIFAINDDTALGALRAVGDADLVIVGYDGTPEACDAIRRGTALKADVVQSPGLIGTRTIGAVADHLAGQPVEPMISVEVGIVDQAMLMKDG